MRRMNKLIRHSSKISFLYLIFCMILENEGFFSWHEELIISVKIYGCKRVTEG